jgi:hypothetical protein
VHRLRDTTQGCQRRDHHHVSLDEVHGRSRPTEAAPRTDETGLVDKNDEATETKAKGDKGDNDKKQSADKTENKREEPDTTVDKTRPADEDDWSQLEWLRYGPCSASHTSAEVQDRGIGRQRRQSQQAQT